MKKHNNVSIYFKNQQEFSVICNFLTELGCTKAFVGNIAVKGILKIEDKKISCFVAYSTSQKENALTISDLEEIKNILSTPVYESGDWVVLGKTHVARGAVCKLNVPYEYFKGGFLIDGVRRIWAHHSHIERLATPAEALSTYGYKAGNWIKLRQDNTTLHADCRGAVVEIHHSEFSSSGDVLIFFKLRNEESYRSASVHWIDHMATWDEMIIERYARIGVHVAVSVDTGVDTEEKCVVNTFKIQDGITWIINDTVLKDCFFQVGVTKEQKQELLKNIFKAFNSFIYGSYGGESQRHKVFREKIEKLIEEM